MKSRWKVRAAVAGLTFLTLGSGLGSAGPVAAATPTTTHYTGVLADGATWIADVPAGWNGTLILYSHGFGPLTALDAPPDPTTQTDLLADGYALVGSSYSGDSLWALASAKKDQFASLAAVEKVIGRPHETLALGTSMGGLISAQEAQDGAGRINGALTTCGLVGGAINLNNYQLDGEYAIATLIAPGAHIRLVHYPSFAAAGTAAKQLADAVTKAQSSAKGRARIALAAALLNTPDWTSGSTPPKSNAYRAQELQEEAGLGGQLAFVIGARPFIELAAGGNSSWNVGVDYAALVQRSAALPQIKALYKLAGLSLTKDLNELTSKADIRPDLHAIANLKKTSTVNGHLAVPELDLHTISDQLAPPSYENLYLKEVQRAGDSGRFRQAFVKAIGHCNFTSSELVAGLQSLRHRISTGSWGNSTAPSTLNREAAASGFGPSAFINYSPPPFVSARSYQP